MVSYPIANNSFNTVCLPLHSCPNSTAFKYGVLADSTFSISTLIPQIQAIVNRLLSSWIYEGYRSIREFQRENENTTDSEIDELLDGESEYWNTENSNKNSKVLNTQRDYMAGIVSKDISRRFLLPPEIVQAHDEGIIHFHDIDYFGMNAMSNCSLINLEDMLQNGTCINKVMIEKPHRFITACTIATQIILGVTSLQYGGATITLTHLAPFVRDSYNKYYRLDMFCQQLHIESADIGEWEDDNPLNYENCDLAYCTKYFKQTNNYFKFDRPLPAVGQKYKHFKIGKIVTIIGISRHTETEEVTVVYDYEGHIWNRPLEMFMSEVDKEKYPNTTQKYRFELVED